MATSQDSEDVLPYDLQIAGHKGNSGFMKNSDGSILKPFSYKDRRSRIEHNFYEKISLDQCGPNEVLRKFLPKFNKIVNLRIDGADADFMSLEDICRTFSIPSVMDVKVGPRTWDSKATAEKIAYEKSKSPYAEVIGFRIIGMKTYDMKNEIYFTKGKSFGKQLTPENVTLGLQVYFSCFPNINCVLLCGFMHDLSLLQSWCSVQIHFAFYATSLLFVYESCLTEWKQWFKAKGLQAVMSHDSATLQLVVQEDTEICDTCGIPKQICDIVRKGCPLFRVAMIDFGHVETVSQSDTNFLFGINKLSEHFKSLIDELCKGL